MPAKKRKSYASRRDPFRLPQSKGVNMDKAVGAVADLATVGIVSVTAANLVGNVGAALKK